MATPKAGATSTPGAPEPATPRANSGRRGEGGSRVLVQDANTMEALDVSPRALCAALVEMHREKEAVMAHRITQLEEMLARACPKTESEPES